MAIISVDGVENVRDLGGISVLDDRKVKSGLFFVVLIFLVSRKTAHISFRMTWASLLL